MCALCFVVANLLKAARAVPRSIQFIYLFREQVPKLLQHFFVWRVFRHVEEIVVQRIGQVSLVSGADAGSPRSGTSERLSAGNSLRNISPQIVSTCVLWKRNKTNATSAEGTFRQAQLCEGDPASTSFQQSTKK